MIADILRDRRVSCLSVSMYSAQVNRTNKSDEWFSHYKILITWIIILSLSTLTYEENLIFLLTSSSAKSIITYVLFSYVLDYRNVKDSDIKFSAAKKTSRALFSNKIRYRIEIETTIANTSIIFQNCFFISSCKTFSSNHLHRRSIASHFVFSEEAKRKSLSQSLSRRLRNRQFNVSIVMIMTSIDQSLFSPALEFGIKSTLQTDGLTQILRQFRRRRCISWELLEKRVSHQDFQNWWRNLLFSSRCWVWFHHHVRF